jgi:hypothetical protein
VEPNLHEHSISTLQLTIASQLCTSAVLFVRKSLSKHMISGFVGPKEKNKSSFLCLELISELSVVQHVARLSYAGAVFKITMCQI